MKSILFFLFLTGLIISAAEAEQIRIMYNGNLYPLEFTDDRGKADGFLIDLIYALARESALEVTLKEGDWRRGDEMLLNNTFDFYTAYSGIKNDSSITRSRQLFSLPFALVYRRVLKPSGEKGLYSRIPLISSGDSSEPILVERSGSSKIIRTKSWSDAVKALEVGYGDYTMVSLLHWNILSDQYDSNLTAMEKFDLVLPYVLYTTKWNSNVLEKLNNSLSIIRASGEYERIYRKWFGEDSDSVIFEDEERNWTGILAAALAAALILIVINRKKRKEKT